jgi:hypothetical protein
MERKHRGVLSCGLPVILATGMLSQASLVRAQSTYNIEELTVFNTGLKACVQNSLNTVTHLCGKPWMPMLGQVRDT